MSLELTWLGHASWQLKTDKHTILVDPFLDDSPTATVKAKDVAADFILVSHGHFDHIADAAQIANRTGATVVSNYEITTWLAKHHGVKNTVGGNLGGGANLPFGRVKYVNAIHTSSLPDGFAGRQRAGIHGRRRTRRLHLGLLVLR
jgi:L-ascorbate metabolism protein UlaG (beta-lactamase superfamily)